MHILFAPLVALLILLTPSLGSAQQGDSDPILLVLDGSGSMWGQINGEPKITIARDVLSGLIDGWSEDTPLGIVAYGHRRKQDCSDIETLIPVAPFDARAVRHAIDSVTPLGHTPLTRAVGQAADALPQGGTIILVTDGIETCEGDPCALGRELAARGINLTTHVVGFDLGGEDTTALQCLAGETGGQYFDASDANGLAAALGSATQAAASGPNMTLRAVDAAGELLPKDSPLGWEVFPIDATGEIGARLVIANGVEKALSLPTGQYHLRATHGEDVVITTQLNIPEGERSVRDIVFAEGEVRLSAHLAEGSDAVAGVFSWVVTREDADGKRQRVAREAGASVRFILPAGQYFTKFSDEDLDHEFEMTVIGGDERSEQVILNAGVLRVAGPSGTSWTLRRIQADGSLKRAASEARAETEFLVAAGQYVAEARNSGDTWSTEIIVAPGDETEIQAEF